MDLALLRLSCQEVEDRLRISTNWNSKHELEVESIVLVLHPVFRLSGPETLQVDTVVLTLDQVFPPSEPETLPSDTIVVIPDQAFRLGDLESH
jgi:hypothetical protein